MSNISKNTIQQWVANNKNKFLILLEWATGTGKSFGAIRLLKETNPKKVLLLVAEENHKNNWKEEFIKFSSIYDYDIISNSDITIECYASLKNYDSTEWDLIILDECHHISDLRRDLLMSLKVKQVCALSATLESNQRYDLICNIFGDNRSSDKSWVSQISLSQAIEWKLIPEPDIYLIPLDLDNVNKDHIVEDYWGIASKRKIIECDYNELWTYKKDRIKYPDITLKIKCTELQKSIFLDNQILYYRNLYMRNGQDHIKNKWLRLGSERKRYLGDLKTKYVEELLKIVKGKRLICFCSSIDQANSIGDTHAIHSKNTLNDTILHRFQQKEIHELYCVGMLTEGQNLVDIEIGIIVQLDGKERPFNQKHGRVLRSENPLQFIFYYKNTRDEEYLNKILDNINKDYIQVINNLKTFTL